jgi:hypothetical protein
MPVRAWLDECAQLSAGTDCPIGFYHPLQSVWGMVTRQTEQVGIRGPENAVDRQTAIWPAGAGTAQLLGESASFGSIELGRYADLVVYRTDPLQCPLERAAQYCNRWSRWWVVRRSIERRDTHDERRLVRWRSANARPAKRASRRAGQPTGNRRARPPVKPFHWMPPSPRRGTGRDLCQRHA